MPPFYRRSLRHKRWAYLYRYLRSRGIRRGDYRAFVRRNGREVKIFGSGYGVRVQVPMLNGAPERVYADYELVAVPFVP